MVPINFLYFQENLTGCWIQGFEGFPGCNPFSIYVWLCEYHFKKSSKLDFCNFQGKI